MGDLAAIDRLAAKQHGVLNSAQLRQWGFDKHAVNRLVQSARWIRLDHRVFCLASAAATWERKMWTALLSRSSAVVGGQSGATLHGLRGFPKARPVIVVPGSANARSATARVIRAEHFDELEIERVKGFPVTTVAETLICLAADLGPIRLEAAFDDALLTRRLNLNAIAAILERESNRRRRGIVRVRRLVAERGPSAPTVGSSYLEGLLESVLYRAEVPTWQREHPFLLAGQPSRVDFFIPSWNLVLEADGRSWHARTGDFESDRQRDNELAGLGIQVLRFTYRVLNSDPEGCVATIRRTGRVRSA